MPARSLVATLALLLIFPPAARAEEPDAFLDQPMPRDIFPFWKPVTGQDPKMRDEVDQFHTFQDRLVALRKWMPRPVVLPGGLYDFVVKIDSHYDPHDTLLSPFQDEGSGSSNGPRVTYREFLTNTCVLLGLAWHYDAKRDALVTDFAWRSNDLRSPRDLVQFLEATNPLPSNDLGMPISKNGSLDYQDGDPWRKALDALISRPENFPHTWRLRFIDDTKGASFCPFAGKILWSGQMSDGHGHPRFVVIKYHPTFSMPGPTASFDCYVFDLHGLFVDGAILSDRYEAISPPSLALSASHTKLLATRGTWSFETADKKAQPASPKPIGSFSLTLGHIVFSPKPTYAGDYLGKIIYAAPQDNDTPAR